MRVFYSMDMPADGFMMTTIAFLISASAFAAVPVIDTDSVSIKQDGSRTVVISYKLEPASAGDSDCLCAFFQFEGPCAG